MLEVTQENLAKTFLENLIEHDREKGKAFLVKIARDYITNKKQLTELEKKVKLLKEGAENIINLMEINLPCYALIEEGIVVFTINGEMYIDDNMIK